MPNSRKYTVIGTPNVPVKAWINGVCFEAEARKQLVNVAQLPFIYKWVAAMPDVHAGMGATIGSVIPTQKAIIPAAVGVDIGCGMTAAKTNLCANQLPDNLNGIRSAIEQAVPHGFSSRGRRDKGSWGRVPDRVAKAWQPMDAVFKEMCGKHPVLKRTNNVVHLGTLGSGNHFIELCLDESNNVWVILHSGSRGVGNRIGTYFIDKAKKDMARQHINLPDKNLAYFQEGSEFFNDYFQAVNWAQNFAQINRDLMMDSVIQALKGELSKKEIQADLEVVNCHHNYVSRENHFGRNVYITRKGAVRAREDELGIIPGSMGAHSYIVRGKGNPESFHSCSHGAGRLMSRTQAKKRFSVADQIKATMGVSCRVDKDVIDEIPMAYKNIDRVIAAQSDLVEPVYVLKQVVCVKG